MAQLKGLNFNRERFQEEVAKELGIDLNKPKPSPKQIENLEQHSHEDDEQD